jgi:hypothetical protein
MTTTDIAGLCERLRRKAGFNDPVTGKYVNFPTQPDGPKAADTIERQAAEIERLRGTLGGIKWRSACKDNMEFSATITCWQMDAIRAALTGEDTLQPPNNERTG